MVHANLNWTFGPLRYFFASPVFHRWHHTMLEEGRDKNFASTFPLLDVLFDTFYMPAGKLPEEFGTGAPDFPEHFWGQMIHPFRIKRKQPSAPSPSLGVTERMLKWARRRPYAAGLVAVSALAVVPLLAMSFIGRQANRTEQPAQQSEQAQLQHTQAESARHAGSTGHGAAVLSVAISADGRRLVSASADGTLKVWDAATGQEKLTLTGHTRSVHSVAISADNTCIVSGSDDKTVKVWDAATGQEKLTLTGHKGPVLSVAVSADGGRIVSASTDFTAKVWDTATGKEQSTLTGSLRSRGPRAPS
jgi:hypothetical protein